MNSRAVLALSKVQAAADWGVLAGVELYQPAAVSGL